MSQYATWPVRSGSGVTPLPNNKILVGNAANMATAVSVSGDLTLVNTGAFTVDEIQGTTVTGTTGTGRVVLGTGPTVTNLNAGTTKITNVLNPSSAQDAATKTYVDTPVAEFGIASSATPTANFANGPSQAVTLTASATFTFSNGQSGGSYLIRVVQGGSGSYTVTWPVSVKWPGGNAPTLSTAVGAVDIIGFYFDGTNYNGSFGLNFS